MEDINGGKKIGTEDENDARFGGLDVEYACVALEAVDNATLDLLAAIAIP